MCILQFNTKLLKSLGVDKIFFRVLKEFSDHRGGIYLINVL